jgi:hypothetical protein
VDAAEYRLVVAIEAAVAICNHPRSGPMRASS